MTDIINGLVELGFPLPVAGSVLAIAFIAIGVCIFDLAFSMIRIFLKKM